MLLGGRKARRPADSALEGYQRHADPTVSWTPSGSSLMTLGILACASPQLAHERTQHSAHLIHAPPPQPWLAP